MKTAYKSRNGGVPETLKQYAERKVAKIEKLFPRAEKIELGYGQERGQYIIEISVEAAGAMLRSQERSSDLHAALDSAFDKVERQIKRFRTRIRDEHRKSETEISAAEPVIEEEESDEPFVPEVVRRKRHPMRPIAPEDAALQMEMLGHDFFVFRNAETQEVNVIYRRRDGHYGLIEPGA